MTRNGSAKTLPLDLLVVDAGTQCRLKISEDTVADYADVIAANGTEWPFPPLHVFIDGSQHLVADGFHRLMAARRSKRASVPCVIHQGTAVDARIFGMTANDNHGLRMSRADKRACVEWLLDNGGRLSQSRIAELAGVSIRLVQQIVSDRKSDSLAGKASPPKRDSKAQNAPNTPIGGETDDEPTGIDKPFDDEQDAEDEQHDEPSGNGESIVLDAVGRPVPAGKQRQHEASAAIQSEARKLDAILRRLKELAGEPGGEFLEVAALENSIKELKGVIFGACYWSECPRCEGAVGKPCQRCLSHGWWPVRLKGKLSAADKNWLGLEKQDAAIPF